jgi:hypothetical protein
MAKYRVNKNTRSPHNDHEIHREGCKWWPVGNFIDLGDHSSCATAVTAAKVYFSDANGCETCSPLCHRG